MGYESTLIKFFFRKRIQKDIKYLINNASNLMSIGAKMSEEYYFRFNRKFYPFHNPIELNQWAPYTKKDFSIQSKIDILFSGRISRFNYSSINNLLIIIDKLNNRGFNIHFDIYSPVNRLFIYKSKNISFYNFVSHDDLPSLISKYDIVYLPLNFDSETIKFAQYSMPTKVSEYMVSGVPILIHAPNETALTQYANQYKFAQVCSVEEGLETSLIELIIDIDLRKQLSKIAVTIGKKYHEASIIRNQFKVVLEQMLEDNYTKKK
jgi:glycosyltransferase involved in cell wall biosynthesis